MAALPGVDGARICVAFDGVPVREKEAADLAWLATGIADPLWMKPPPNAI